MKCTCRECGHQEESKNGWNLCNKCTGELFRKYAVTDVETVADFLEKYGKHDRYQGQGAEYMACTTAHHQQDMDSKGWTIISHHDSRTGEIVALFAKAGTQ